MPTPNRGKHRKGCCVPIVIEDGTAESGVQAAMIATAAATEPEWRAIHRAADANVPRIQRILTKAFRAAQDETRLADIEESLEHGGIPLGKVFAGADAADAILVAELPGAIYDTLVAGGFAAARTARSQGGFIPSAPLDQDVPPGQIDPDTPAEGPIAQPVVEETILAEGGLTSVFVPGQDGRPGFALTPDFATTNPEAVKWAEEFSSTQIRRISNETRRNIRQIIANAFVDGTPPAKAAQQIRAELSLTRKQSEAVRNLRKEMRDRVRGQPVRRGGRTFPGPRSIPRGGYTSRQIDAAAARYSKRLIADRALNIARTETITAANEGQRQLWLQARQNGTIPSNMVRDWIVTPDDQLCPICRGMIGKQAGLNEPFQTSRGPVMGPTAHPSCRCAVGLAHPKDKTTGARPPSQGDILSKSPISKSTQLGSNTLNPVQRLIMRDAATGEEATGYWKPSIMDPVRDAPNPVEASRMANLIDDTVGRAGGTFGDREVMASQLDDIFGTRLVPKTVYREVDGVAGTIQLEGAGTVGDVMTIDDALKAVINTVERQQDLTLFDMIMANGDRHAGNVLIGKDLVAIDNGFGFMTGRHGLFRTVFTINEELTQAEPLLSATRKTQWLKRLKDPRVNRLLDDGRISKEAADLTKDRIAQLIDALEHDGNFWKLMLQTGG